MKIEVHENWIRLTPQSHLENSCLERWRNRIPQKTITSIICKDDVSWSDRPLDTFGIRIDFVDTPDDV